jgi:hypothetical protein
MRTTVTLDPPADAYVKRLMREKGLSFKEAVNRAILDGASAGKRRKPFQSPTFDMGPAQVPLDKALQLAGELENQEILRKIRVGK